MPVLAVVMHQMPEDRLVADWNHRLRDVLRIVADARAEASAEQHCFHGSSLSLTVLGVGLSEPLVIEMGPSAELDQATASGTTYGQD